jgi:hypothetical protein
MEALAEILYGLVGELADLSASLLLFPTLLYGGGGSGDGDGDGDSESRSRTSTLLAIE